MPPARAAVVLFLFLGVLGSTLTATAAPARSPAPTSVGAASVAPAHGPGTASPGRRPAAGAGHRAPAVGADSAVLAPPLDEAVVLAPFRAPPERWSPGHRGVDLRAAAGVPVLAPGPGVVSFADTVVDRAVLTVLHPGGLRSSLEPVHAEVAVGAQVTTGQRLGTVQAVATHCAPASCLHWGVRRDQTYLDPLSLLAGAGPVVLLPDR